MNNHIYNYFLNSTKIVAMELFYVFNFRTNARVAGYSFPLTTDQIDYVDLLLRNDQGNSSRFVLFDFQDDGRCSNPAMAFCEILRKSLKSFSMYIDDEKIDGYSLYNSKKCGMATVVTFVVGKRRIYNQLLL